MQKRCLIQINLLFLSGLNFFEVVIIRNSSMDEYVAIIIVIMKNTPAVGSKIPPTIGRRNAQKPVILFAIV